MPYANFAVCTHIKDDGTECGKKCIDGLCSYHKNSPPKRLCCICGHVTRSSTGICSLNAICHEAQHIAVIRNIHAKKAAQKKNDDLDRLVDELVGT